MSIPLILASKSKPRRDVLYSAGICPTIRVSHVDEPAALEAAAREEGVTVDDLSIKQRVMILAVAKAEAVHRAYRDVANTAAAATGDRVIATRSRPRKSRIRNAKPSSKTCVKPPLASPLTIPRRKSPPRATSPASICDRHRTHRHRYCRTAGTDRGDSRPADSRL